MAKSKRIMRSLTIKEIAGVDRPAQEPALAVLMKREESSESAGDPGGGQETVKEQDMTDSEKAAAEKTSAAEKRVQALEAELAKANALCALTDSEKAHYGKLDESGKVAFLKLSVDQRKSEVGKANDSDPVVYKDADGNEYRKSDDQRVIDAAKRADAAFAAARLANDRAERAQLEKRADEVLKHLPGDQNAKCALLKAVDGIADEALRTKCNEMLKANGEKLAEAFQARGSEGSPVEKNADNQIEEMAKKYAETNKVDIVKARVAVLHTPEGRALYAKTISRPSAA
jgi:hypothetical protein